MSKLFINYPKCSTCKKAEKFLKENNIEFINRNTSGVLYREMNLKDKIKTMSKEEMIEILSTNGMLVKRPLLVMDDKVLVGFKEENYKEII